MNVSLYEAAAALTASAHWQDIISQNLASSTIPGYKKQDLSYSAVSSGMMSSPTNGVGKNQLFAIPQTATSTNFQQGALKLTSVETDVVIIGTSFFQVQLPNGDKAYTRDGEFQINPQGQLVTKQGYLVLGDSGPIQLDIDDSAPLSISGTGEVTQGTDSKGSLALAEFNDVSLLQTIGGGLFIGNDPKLLVTTPTTVTVRQGYLESSNTSSVSEMIQLVAAMRHFETNQRIIQMHDQRMERVINELGNPS